jgi:hypothetical protein
MIPPDHGRVLATLTGVIGVVILLVAMLVVGPVGLFVVGAIWSGLFGWGLADDADTQAEAQPSAS